MNVENLSLRYDESMPMILKNISFSLRNNERTGIVGRTGAGKSSLIEALMRIVEPEEGSIYEIAGENVLELPLHSLRKKSL